MAGIREKDKLTKTKMSVLNEPVTEASTVPANIWQATVALLETHPPSNPVINMRTAEWWYKNGRGANDPAFKYAIRYLDKSVNDNIAVGGDGDDLDLYAELRDYVNELRDNDEKEI